MDLYSPSSALVFLSFTAFYRSLLEAIEKGNRYKLILAEKHNPLEKGE